MRSRGWFVKSDPKYIVIAGTLDADVGGYGETIAIPRAMIETLEVIQ